MRDEIFSGSVGLNTVFKKLAALAMHQNYIFELFCLN